jgi:hypothetical protein
LRLRGGQDRARLSSESHLRLFHCRLHIFIGLLLIPPIALKLASTGYRFVRYYTRHVEYVLQGPPMLLMRILVAPGLVAATAALFSTGVALLVIGPGGGVVLGLHKASFVVWIGAFAIHVLAYAAPNPASGHCGLGSWPGGSWNDASLRAHGADPCPWADPRSRRAPGRRFLVALGRRRALGRFCEAVRSLSDRLEREHACAAERPLREPVSVRLPCRSSLSCAACRSPGRRRSRGESAKRQEARLSATTSCMLMLPATKRLPDSRSGV